MASSPPSLRDAQRLMQAGRLSEAERLVRALLTGRPGDRTALLVLAGVLRAQRRFQEALALLQPLVLADPNDMAPVGEAAITFHMAGRLDEAIQGYQRVLQMDPTAVPIRYNLARALLDRYQTEAAIRVLREAREIEPNNVDLVLALAHAHLTHGDPSRAIPLYEKAVRVRPGAAEVWSGLGTCRRIIGDAAGAKVAFENALKFQPDLPAAIVGLSKVFEEQGEPDRALAMIEPQVKAGRTAPELMLAYAAHLERKGRATDGILLLQKAMEVPGGPVFGRSLLLNTLGSLLEKTGEYEKAWEAYRGANEIVPRTFNPATHVGLTDRLVSTYSEAYFQDASHQTGRTSELPLLIVGMPRSGTSLLEQILSCHSRIHAAGELSDLSRLAMGAARRLKSAFEFPECVRHLNRSDLDQLAGDYHDRLNELAASSGKQVMRVTDKMPQNYLFLGLFASMFPRGRIIHSMRHPLDTCLSCYTTSLSANYNYTNDLGDLAVVYKQYRRLMSHWHATLPVSICDISYEDLVAHKEVQSRHLVEAAGLPWDDACLSHHESRRVVRTASMEQAKKPVYSTSVARWKRFEKQLAPLAEALADYL